MPPNGQKSLFSAECHKSTNDYLGKFEKSHPQEKAFVYGSVRSKSMSTVAKGGFTLFEVSISLAIMAFAVISVLMLFPAGIKMQTQARFQFLASTKALELMEHFSSKPNHERIADYETPAPWEARPFCYTSSRWDMESRMSRYDAGVMPVPLDIARRLESDNNEIQNLLAEGAYLYYADPRSVPGIDLQYKHGDAANESHKLVFAVSGHAQHNAIPVFPYKAWPYRAVYPSPPQYSEYKEIEYFKGQPDFSIKNAFEYEVIGQITDPKDPTKKIDVLNTNTAVCWEGWTNGDPGPITPDKRDPRLNDIFKATITYNKLVGAPVFKPVSQADREIQIKTVRDPLIDAVLAYCEEKFSTKINDIVDEYNTYVKATTTTGGGFIALGRDYDAKIDALCSAAELTKDDIQMSSNLTKDSAKAKMALRVQCLRYLAFAMNTFNQQRNGETTIDWSSTKAKDIPISKERLQYYRDRCLYAVMRYSASFPYDWGAPRPVSRCIMMDWDLFTQPRTGNILGTSPATKAAMWKPLSAQYISSIGLPSIFPGVLNGTAFNAAQSPFAGTDDRVGGHSLWGNAHHFTLTKPFQVAERCRQLVFWSVDWQAYVDAETAPSAPLDASRCPLSGIRSNSINASYAGRLNMKPHPVDGLHFRNPEREMTFLFDMSKKETGTDLRIKLQPENEEPVLKDYGDGRDLRNRSTLSGMYGADRNHNYKLDRGILPTSARQRATLVARFNFYDPRLPIILR